MSDLRSATRAVAIDLLLITPGFPANEQDSTCIPPLQEYLLALRQARPRLRIHVIALQYPFTRREYTWNDIRVTPCGGANRKWTKPLIYLLAQRAAKRAAKNVRPHAVHSLWLGEAAWLGQRIAVQLGARHVITLMGQDARDGRLWWERLRRGSTTVAVSERQAHVYTDTFNEAISEVVPWGSPIVPINRKERTNDLLFCGSLLEVKRPLLFIDTVAQVHAQRAVKAVMIGDGPLRKDVEAAIAARGLREVIAVRGTLARTEVYEEMQRSRVLLHTSSFESQGYVFDEALACGMRIVSGPVGSARPASGQRVCGDEDLARNVLELLDAPAPETPFVLHPMRDTVRDYLRCYGIA